jgi:hypothetical protein
LRKLDIRRREHRAEFNIKQRDKIIEHLKEQLQLRDQIIKEKFGVSISNFLPSKEEPPATKSKDTVQAFHRTNSKDPLAATFYKTATADNLPTAPDYEKLFTMKDID